eukprot:GHVQ01004721.1.p1 GENE.GHVQ01004721.1~~GHVQ01004721.1.p1  ORF type:complete len:1152 (-),score=181.89 GHVQ01004721.1:3679-7134(-)
MAQIGLDSILLPPTDIAYPDHPTYSISNPFCQPFASMSLTKAGDTLAGATVDGRLLLYSMKTRMWYSCLHEAAGGHFRSLEFSEGDTLLVGVVEGRKRKRETGAEREGGKAPSSGETIDSRADSKNGAEDPVGVESVVMRDDIDMDKQEHNNSCSEGDSTEKKTDRKDWEHGSGSSVNMEDETMAGTISFARNETGNICHQICEESKTGDGELISKPCSSGNSETVSCSHNYNIDGSSATRVGGDLRAGEAERDSDDGGSEVRCPSRCGGMSIYIWDLCVYPVRLVICVSLPTLHALHSLKESQAKRKTCQAEEVERLQTDRGCRDDNPPKVCRGAQEPPGSQASMCGGPQMQEKTDRVTEECGGGEDVEVDRNSASTQKWSDALSNSMSHFDVASVCVVACGSLCNQVGLTGNHCVNSGQRRWCCPYIYVAMSVNEEAPVMVYFNKTVTGDSTSAEDITGSGGSCISHNSKTRRSSTSCCTKPYMCCRYHDGGCIDSHMSFKPLSQSVVDEFSQGKEGSFPFAILQPARWWGGGWNKRKGNKAGLTETECDTKKCKEWEDVTDRDGAVSKCPRTQIKLPKNETPATAGNASSDRGCPLVQPKKTSDDSAAQPTSETEDDKWRGNRWDAITYFDDDAVKMESLVSKFQRFWDIGGPSDDGKDYTSFIPDARSGWKTYAATANPPTYSHKPYSAAHSSSATSKNTTDCSCLFNGVSVIPCSSHTPYSRTTAVGGLPGLPSSTTSIESLIDGLFSTPHIVVGFPNGSLVFVDLQGTCWGHFSLSGAGGPIEIIGRLDGRMVMARYAERVVVVRLAMPSSRVLENIGVVEPEPDRMQDERISECHNKRGRSGDRETARDRQCESEARDTEPKRDELCTESHDEGEMISAPTEESPGMIDSGIREKVGVDSERTVYGRESNKSVGRSSTDLLLGLQEERHLLYESESETEDNTGLHSEVEEDNDDDNNIARLQTDILPNKNTMVPMILETASGSDVPKLAKAMVQEQNEWECQPQSESIPPQQTSTDPSTDSVTSPYNDPSSMPPASNSDSDRLNNESRKAWNNNGRQLHYLVFGSAQVSMKLQFSYRDPVQREKYESCCFGSVLNTVAIASERMGFNHVYLFDLTVESGIQGVRVKADISKVNGFRQVSNLSVV